MTPVILGLDLRRWAGSPSLLLASVALGALLGFAAPGTAAALAPVGEAYLALLEMCALPILMTALASAVARALASGEGARYLRRFALTFAVALLVAAGVGILAGAALAPGEGLGAEQRAAFGAHVLEVEGPNGAPAAAPTGGLAGFLRAMVPENVFQAAAAGAGLPLVTFCVLLGLGLGSLRDERGATAIRLALAALFVAQLYGVSLDWGD
jgi:Na+/H+-dicarboxylate symporter